VNKVGNKWHRKVLTLHIPLGKGLYWAQFRTVLILLSEGNETFLFCSMIGGNTMLQLCHVAPVISVELFVL